MPLCRSGQQLAADRRKGAPGGRGGGAAGPGVPGKGGAGTKMLETMRRQGRPVDERMQRMAAWMDSLEQTDPSEVRALRP